MKSLAMLDHGNARAQGEPFFLQCMTRPHDACLLQVCGICNQARTLLTVLH